MSNSSVPARALAAATYESDGFDECRVPISGALRTLLLSAEELDPEQRSATRLELLELLRRYVDDGPGLLVLTGIPVEIDVARAALLRLTSLLGAPLPQNREGLLVKDVRDRGTAIGEGERARYSDSRFGGNLHTDGVEAPLPAPEVFTLLCVRQSERGGALQVVHVRDLVRALSEWPEVLETLREPFHFDRRGDQERGEPPTVRKPVLFEQRERQAIAYLRSYIELGHEHSSSTPLTDRQRRALDTLDRIIGTLALTRVGKLREGELAIFDNLSLLHGRTEFEDDFAHTRLLLRTWIRLSD
ncbi:TauD/TfdA family dioxygenase [Nocardia sp. NPDC051052]|uniref:TauD/TfdA family dioxygenase n=1 Tax=Nocardia sp. NPDC051052 TaxID=3364322 RepID=UPI0037997E43